MDTAQTFEVRPDSASQALVGAADTRPWCSATFDLSVWTEFLSSALARVVLINSIALAAVLVSARLVHVGPLRIHGLADTLNDQAGYVSVARNLIATGELRSSIIIPSLLAQPTDATYLYMPGHYVALALSYALFGFGPIQSILPSIVAYIIATTALFLTVAHFYGRNVGTTAALLFALFPANIVYSLTAMAEMTLLAAAMVSLAMFSFLSFKLRVVLGPLLLTLPLLFRETGLALAIVFFLLIVFNDDRLHLKAIVLFIALSTVVAVEVLLSPVSVLRPSLAPFNILLLDERKLYADAFTLERINPTLIDWIVAPFTKFAYNAHILAVLFWSLLRNMFSANPFAVTGVAAFEVLSLALILLGIPFGLFVVLRRPQHTLVIASVAVPAVILLAILSLYYVLYLQAVRILMLAVPFECILFAVMLRRTFKVRPLRIWGWRSRQLLIAACLALGFGLSVGVTYVALAPDDAAQARAERETAFLESIGHNPDHVLVTPWQIAFDYVYQHPTVEWSFIPANRATLDLLNESKTVGTIVVPTSDAETDLTVDDIMASGFHLEATLMLDGHSYDVFKAQPTQRAI
jgi:hypothetical protein